MAVAWGKVYEEVDEVFDPTPIVLPNQIEGTASTVNSTDVWVGRTIGVGSNASSTSRSNYWKGDEWPGSSLEVIQNDSYGSAQDEVRQLDLSLVDGDWQGYDTLWEVIDDRAVLGHEEPLLFDPDLDDGGWYTQFPISNSLVENLISRPQRPSDGSFTASIFHSRLEQDEEIFLPSFTPSVNSNNAPIYASANSEAVQRNRAVHACNYATFRIVDSSPKSLFSNSDLDHNKKKPECPICGKLFSSNSTRNRHVKHHGSKSLFHCPDCVKGYETKSNMQRHRKTCQKRNVC
ncbi:hypothetical protein BX600DRAFT_498862 [Xylariales sp. PMI_506]|nr:hypothetical protein BX600DRAFT_498862 [Xylariales sp. PMI_506]